MDSSNRHAYSEGLLEQEIFSKIDAYGAVTNRTYRPGHSVHNSFLKLTPMVRFPNRTEHNVQLILKFTILSADQGASSVAATARSRLYNKNA